MLYSLASNCVRVAFCAATAIMLVAPACSSSAPGTSAGSGGASKGGGSGSGGIAASGGTTSTGGGQGGAGGIAGTGGTLVGTGGRASGGSTTGTGGTVAQGGAGGTAGSSARGGTTGSGGASASGGAVTGGTTGATATGGRATGGSTGGGGAATGGVSSTGGVSTAGASGTGGATGKGGASGTGGATATGPALAFPGAQGFGKKATGGRNGVVYHVTNLDDSGTGSFRDAVSASGRIVVFDVGGYIQLKTAVSAKSDLTIAGQTAPGQGIGFRGGEISFANQSNIIVRHIRIRPGSETASTDDDALSLYLAGNVIIDHTSLELAPWNNIDGVGTTDNPVTDITFQDSLVADPTGQQFGAHTESVGGNWAWYRTIFANSHNRNPLAKVNNVFVNNLLYNCQAGYTTHTSTSFSHDIINNYFVAGPSSTAGDFPWFQIDQNQSIYYAGNLYDADKDGTLNGATTTPDWYQGTGTVLSRAWSPESTAATPLDAPSAARAAISRAGALPRDELDQLTINQVQTLGKGSPGTGAGTAGSLYTSQTETGLANNGYGSIAGGTRPTDADNDGMPDSWESATGSDPAKDDAMTKAADGYALIERYLNWLAEPHATSAAGAAVDVDLSALSVGFSGVAPTYAVAGAQNGTVALGTDNHTAHFQPTAGFHGLASFSFTVTGSDKTAFTDQVVVLVTP